MWFCQRDVCLSLDKRNDIVPHIASRDKGYASGGVHVCDIKRYHMNMRFAAAKLDACLWNMTKNASVTEGDRYGQGGRLRKMWAL